MGDEEAVSGKKCAPCLKPLMESICKLVKESDRQECERIFVEYDPAKMVAWLKAKGVRTEDFMRALEGE